MVKCTDPSPAAPPHSFKLNDSAILHDVMAIYECDEGYVKGPKHGISMCMNGTWTTDKLVECFPINGKYNFSYCMNKYMFLHLGVYLYIKQFCQNIKKTFMIYFVYYLNRNTHV